MRLQIHYLVVRKGRFVFRIGIPHRLQEAFGRREIKKVLPLQNLKEAALFCRLYADKIKILFIKAEDEPMLLDKLEKLLREYYNEKLEEAKAYYLTTAFSDVATKQAEIQKLLDRKQEIEEHRELNKWIVVADVADAVIRDAEGNLKNDQSEDYLQIAHELLEVHPRFCDEKIKMINGDFSGTVEGIVKLPDQQPVTALQSTLEPLLEEPAILKDLYAEYRAEKIRTNSWTGNTSSAPDGVYALLAEVYGENVDMRTLTHKKLKHLRDNILIKLPARRNIGKKYEGKGYKEIIKMKGIKPMCVRTVNEKVGYIAGFFKWATKHDYIPRNTAADLQEKDNRSKDSLRKVYDADDLERMLLALKALPKAREERYWVALIAIFSGLRQGEICQLFTNDIILEDGVYCFSVNDEGEGKKVKTESAKRLVPIHSTLLIELDFLGYITELRKKKVKRLWPKLTLSRDGYGQKFQRWYGRFNRRHITEDKKKVFHSTRHGFATSLKKHDVDETTIKELMGHANESITSGQYGKKHEVDKLLKAIMKLDYGIDIVKIMTGKPGKSFVALEQKTATSAPVAESAVEITGSSESVAHSAVAVSDLHEFDNL